MRVFAVDAAQLQISGCVRELHIEPAMGMAFAKVVADGGLVDQMKVIHLVMLPLMRVAIEISSGILSLGEKFQQCRAITHPPDGAHASVGVGIEMAKNEDPASAGGRVANHLRAASGLLKRR